MELSEAPAQFRLGFKRTEVGVLPETWQSEELQHLGSGSFPAVKAGPFGSSLTKATYVPFGYKVYGQEQVIRGDHTYGDYFIGAKKYQELQSCSVRPGDVLLSLVGTAGKVLVIPSGASEGVINPRLVRFSFDRNRIDPWFFKEIFESEPIQALLRQSAQGGTMGVLNASILRSIKIPVPPLPEQRAIATALSDVDGLLAGLDALIAKKKALKQGAMQQLLTGKQRLPGFKGEWVVRRLGDVLKLRHGKPQHAVEKHGGKYPILGTGGIMAWTDDFLYDKPSVLIGRKGTIDVPQYMDTPFWTVDTLFYSEVSPKANAKFLYYRFWLIDWYRYNESSGVPSMIASTVENIEIKAPPSREEQTAIAEVLSDMDAELGALEARRAKTALLKQGMMQELLTGRTRLV